MVGQKCRFADLVEMQPFLAHCPPSLTTQLWSAVYGRTKGSEGPPGPAAVDIESACSGGPAKPSDLPLEERFWPPRMAPRTPEAEGFAVRFAKFQSGVSLTLGMRLSLRGLRNPLLRAKVIEGTSLPALQAGSRRGVGGGSRLAYSFATPLLLLLVATSLVLCGTSQGDDAQRA